MVMPMPLAAVEVGICEVYMIATAIGGEGGGGRGGVV